MPYDFLEILPKGVLDNPLSLLCFYDGDIQRGVTTQGKQGVVLDEWQREILIFLGKEHNYTDPAIRAMLLAANGSGKSKFILAPFAIWMLMRYIESLTVITTASGAQLDRQDLRYCTMLARKINTFHQEHFPEGIIDCQYRKLKNKINGSFIDMFATDEPGKAEGNHPLHKDGKFCIIVDEGKTVVDDIYDALERCTGFTHRLDISSAGRNSGQFYTDWNFIDSTVLKKKITAYDCSHLKNDAETAKKIEKHGINDPLIRSSIFSEFSSSDQQVVVYLETLNNNVARCNKFYDFGNIRAGLDLAAGGDENVFTIWKGNKELERHNFKFSDTNKTKDYVIDIIKSYRGDLRPENIYTDDSGLGRGVIDNFYNTKDVLFPEGYKLTRVINQSIPHDKTRYANRGAEAWFTFKRFLEAHQVLFKLEPNGKLSKTLLEQLTNRQYFISKTTSKITLEAKADAKAHGRPSPDQADAIILAWIRCMYPIKEMAEIIISKNIRKESNLEDVAQKMRRSRMDNYWAIRNGILNKGLLMPKVYSSDTGNKKMTQFANKDVFKQPSNRKF